MRDGKGYRQLQTVDDEPRSSSFGSFPTQPWFKLTSYALLLISNLIFLSLWLKSYDCPDCIRPRLIYSPAKEDGALGYENRRLWRNIEDNVFTGDPRPEFDLAWRKLIEPITIKISSEELSRLHADSIAFADGSGYIAEMAVYHELHCIKRIRRHFYLDRYYPDMSPEERVKEDAHIDHCLEYWREATMCRGDTAITTFRWVDGFPFSRVDSEHECVNWERLDTWARERMVNMSDYTKFIH